MLLFCRAGVIYSSVSHLVSLLKFTGIGINSVPFMSRLQQYSEFIYGIFFSPNAGLHEGDFVSWQLYQPDNINFTGLIILAITLISTFINRRSKICRLSFLWIVFSFILLCIVGWGTAENCLMLYSLYFSWAFYVLAFMLAVRAEQALSVRFILPVLLVAAVYVLVRVSFPAILELADFGAKYYPYAW